MSSSAHQIPGLPPSAYYIRDFITEAEEAYLLRKIAESPLPRWKTVGTGRRLQYLGGTLTKKNILIPEPLPAYCTEFPDLVDRICKVTDVFRTAEDAAEGETGAPNQLLINEYAPGQGIAPHEDGPAYHPAVATISLSSGQCIDLYQYLSETDPSPPLTASATAPEPGTASNGAPSDTADPSSATPADASADAPASPHGKPIAAIPLARIYLEPRSLLILSSSLYQSHLHGISSTTRDILTPPFLTPSPIANLSLLAPEIQRAVGTEGAYTAERGTRVSLTFRRVVKVFKGGLAGSGTPGKKGLLGRR